MSEQDITPEISPRSVDEDKAEIGRRRSDLVDTLCLLPPGEERLLYMINLGRKYPGLPDELRTKENLLPGCVSQLWISCQKRPDGTLEFPMDADAAISKGIAAAVCDLYNGMKPEAILGVEPDFFEPTGLTSLISPNRSNALSNLRNFVVKEAAAHASK